MTATQESSKISPSGDQKKDSASKPLESSRFNELSISLTFAITGLAVVYLPNLPGKSIDWRVEGRFLGIALALAGAAFTLAAAQKLTGRAGFGYWGVDIIIGTVIAGTMAAVHVYRLPKWSAIVLIILAIVLLFVGIYAMVSGFTIFFDEQETTSGEANLSDSNVVQNVTIETKREKTLSWYERITLIIAIVSTIATLAAAIEPVIHP